MKFEISFLPTPRNLSFIQPQEAEIIQVDPARIRKLDLILTPSNLNSLIQECQAGRQDRLSTRNSGDGGGDQLSLPTTDREDQGSLFQISGRSVNIIVIMNNNTLFQMLLMNIEKKKKAQDAPNWGAADF